MDLDEEQAKLPEDLQLLVSKGTISHEQALAVLQARITHRPKRALFSSEHFIRFLTIFGAILVGIGVILFFAANWREVPSWAKITLLIASTIGAYVIGYILRFLAQRPAFGEAAFLIGSFLYGTSIFLILQTYHIPAEYPNEVLFWWLGILPLGYLLRLRSVTALAHLLMLFWFGYALFDSGRVELTELMGLYISLGAFLLVLGRWYESFDFFKVHAVFLRGLGYTALGVALFPFTSIRFGEFIVRSTSDSGAGVFFWLLYLSFALLSGLLGVVFFLRSFPKNTGVLMELFGAPVIALITAPFFAGGIGPSLGVGIFFNLLYLVFILGLIAIGYFERNRGFVNLGVTILVMDILIRYFEFARSLLQGAAFFIIGGLLLIGIAIVLDKLRRELIKRIEQPSNL